MLRLRLSVVMAFIILMAAGITQTEISPAGAQLSADETSRATNAVRHEIFEEYLGRRATADELAHLPTELNVQQVRVRVLGSNAFYQHVGATNRAFIVELHREVLDRAPLHLEFARSSERIDRSTETEVRTRELLALALLQGTDYRTPGTSAFPFWPDRVFDDQRVIAFYGSHVTAELGVLGETGPHEAIQRVKAAAAPFSTSQTASVGAFEMIVTVAQASAGLDGNFSKPSDLAAVTEWVDLAEQHGIYVILDIQPGRSDFLTESKRYESLLLRPHVGLALDPEWRMGPTQRPGEVVGRVAAAEVNEVSAWLSELVRSNDLPEKIFIIHQFQERMIVNRETLIDRPGLATTIHADGFGGREAKQATYSRIHVDAPFYNGFKLFIDEDSDVYQPAEILGFTNNPVPDFVSYQ